MLKELFIMLELFITFVSNILSFSPFITIFAILTALSAILLIRRLISW